LFGRLRNPVPEIRAFLDYFEERVGNPKFIPAFIDAAKQFIDLCGNDLPGRGLYLYMISSSMTRCGTALAWLDGENLTFRQIELNPEEIERKGALDDYWASLPSPNPYVNWGYLIKGHDVPIDPENNDRGWSRFSIDGSVQEISASADALLEEAVADKKWTIPRHAIVELSFGPFNSLEVSEIGREVYFVCRTAGERFQIASVRPDKHICTFRPAFEVDGMDPEQKARVEAGVKLLFSAIIRDFWVVEELRKFFRPVKSLQEKRVARDLMRILVSSISRESSIRIVLTWNVAPGSLPMRSDARTLFQRIFVERIILPNINSSWRSVTVLRFRLVTHLFVRMSEANRVEKLSTVAAQQYSVSILLFRNSRELPAQSGSNLNVTYMPL